MGLMSTPSRVWAVSRDRNEVVLEWYSIAQCQIEKIQYLKDCVRCNIPLTFEFHFVADQLNCVPATVASMNQGDVVVHNIVVVTPALVLFHQPLVHDRQELLLHRQRLWW